MDVLHLYHLVDIQPEVNLPCLVDVEQGAHVLVASSLSMQRQLLVPASSGIRCHYHHCHLHSHNKKVQFSATIARYGV
jgi:hypothetical protein